MRLKCLGPTLGTLDTRTARPPKAPPKQKLPFYNSPSWRKFVAALIVKRGRQCEECGARGCKIFGDHIEELQDGGAPLDEDNVLLRSFDCHARKTGEKNRKPFDGPDLVHPPGLKPAAMPLVIVCGPPASGKTTYVSRNRLVGDLVIDLDVIKAKLTGLPLHSFSSQYLGAALKERNKILTQLGDEPARWPRAWFIVGEPAAHWRAWWAEQLHPLQVVVLETPEDVCLERIASAPERAMGRAPMSESVTRWWNEYRPRQGDLVVRAA